MNTERRNQTGLVVVTSRATQFEQRCKEAGMLARILPVQPGAAWPEHRPPVLLDTVGMSRQDLIGLLARSPAYSRPAYDKPALIMALASAHDWLALRLLAICPAIRVISPDDPALLWDWLQRCQRLGLQPLAASSKIWLIDQPADAWLDPLLLRILAALPIATDHKQIAAACSVSPSKLFRTLRDIRGVLGLPPGEESRFCPAVLAEQIITRMAEPAALAGRVSIKY